MKGLTDYEKFLLVRPLPNDWPRELSGMPIIKKQDFDVNEIDKVKFDSFSNLKSIKQKDKSILLFFQYDKSMSGVWNNPMKYVSKFSGLYAITTPDYSLYTNMDRQKISENVYHNRWLGAFYQSHGFKVIPTVSWADEDTYDVCFSGIEKGSIVCISTIGCQLCKEKFISGYKKLMETVNPPLLLVKGKVISGMFGKIRIIDFEDTFSKKENYEQLEFIHVSKILNLKGGNNYGW